MVAGASGLIGSALVDSLRADGVRVTTLVRRPAEAPDEVEWLTDGGLLDPAVLEGAHAVVGMNGASIGRFPWTRSYKSTLLWSRITPTRTLATAIKALGADAPAFVSASAVGYYGSVPGREAHRILAARRVVPRRPVRRVGVRRARARVRTRVWCSPAPRRSCIRGACSSRSCC